ncbi:MAG: MBL fold metallo-hydrolase [Acidimicrobiia bacterium]
MLVTHQHPDHFDIERLTKWASADQSRHVFGPEAVVSQLGEVDAGQRHAVEEGDGFGAAGFEVLAVGRSHARIHPDIPLVPNVAYLIEECVLHPGDSFTPPPPGVSVGVLTLPVSAPWLKVAEAVDYLRQVGPSVAIPIHDGFLNDAGKALHDRVIGGLAGELTYQRLDPGEPLTVTPPG